MSKKNNHFIPQVLIKQWIPVNLEGQVFCYTYDDKKKQINKLLIDGNKNGIYNKSKRFMRRNYYKIESSADLLEELFSVEVENDLEENLNLLELSISSRNIKKSTLRYFIKFAAIQYIRIYNNFRNIKEVADTPENRDEWKDYIQRSVYGGFESELQNYLQGEIFFLTSDSEDFILSSNPVVLIHDKNDDKLSTLFFALTPKLMICMRKNHVKSKKIKVIPATNINVKSLNYFILNNPNLSYDSKYNEEDYFCFPQDNLSYQELFPNELKWELKIVSNNYIELEILIK